MIPSFVCRRRQLRGDWYAKVESLNITPIKVNLNLIKPQKEPVLEHYNYPLDKPIIVQLKPHRDLNRYLLMDGHHRYQQAKALGHTEILSIIVPWPTPKLNA